MKSRLLSTVWLSLLLLFAQQVAFADSLGHAYGSTSDHQYAFEERSSSDDAARHLFLDNFDGLPSTFSLPVTPSWTTVYATTGIVRIAAVVTRFYSSRAPPLL